MQLWVTHWKPDVAAYALDDVRLGDAIVATRAIIERVDLDDLATIWTRSRPAAYHWTMSHHFFLSREYEMRFGKTHEQSLPMKQQPISQHPMKFLHEKEAFLNQARSELHRIDYTYMNVYDAYRFLLNTLWDITRPKWTKRRPPDFHGRDTVYYNPSHFQMMAVGRIRNIVLPFYHGKVVKPLRPNPQKGELPCPRCGFTLAWRCTGNKYEVHFRCDDCIQYRGSVW